MSILKYRYWNILKELRPSEAHPKMADRGPHQGRSEVASTGGALNKRKQSIAASKISNEKKTELGRKRPFLKGALI